MKRRFAIVIAFLLVVLIAATLVACNFNDGNKPSGNVDDINKNDDTTTKDIVLRDDMTLEELKEVIKDVKSATVKAYGEDNQLMWEAYYKDNVRITYIYGDEDSRKYDTTGFALDGTLCYCFYKRGDDTEMTVVDYSGYDYDFSAISCSNGILDYIEYFDIAIENNTIVFNEDNTEFYTIVFSNFNHTEFALPEEFANYKEEAETRSMVEFEATPLEDDDTKCKITNINSNDSFNLLKSIDIVIPEIVDGRTVTEIGTHAFGMGDFSDTKISVTIPDGVTSIGIAAFSGCSGLTTITIPDSVTSIGDFAFNNCSELKSITVSNSVTNIGSDAFFGCTGLSSVTIPESVTNIGDHAFAKCSGLTSITLPDGVTSIGWGAFADCAKLTTVNWNATACTRAQYVFEDCFRLTELNIGDNVTTIPAHAFRNCLGLTSVTIPNSVTSIGEYAFADCWRLVEVYNKSTLDIEANRWESNGFVYILNVYTEEGGSKLSIDNNGYEIYTDEGTKSLVAYHGTETDIVLPSGITTINQYAFMNYDEITGVVIPEGVKTIECDVFHNCTGLKSVIIPNSLTSIAPNAFNNCSGLTNVTIGSGVTSIGAYAFNGCTELTSIAIPDNVEIIGDYAFKNCSGLTSVTIGSGVTSIGYEAFSGCTGLANIDVSENNVAYASEDGIVYNKVKTEIAYVPRGIKGSVAIPSSVHSIGENAFSDCTGLTEIIVKNTVTNIGDYAFKNCTGLISVTIGGGVQSIGKNAFFGCESLTTINWNAVYCTNVGYFYDTTIYDGNYAYIFEGCNNVTTINISRAVIKISYGTFVGCPESVIINYDDTESEWAKISKDEKWFNSHQVICGVEQSAKPSLNQIIDELKNATNYSMFWSGYGETAFVDSLKGLKNVANNEYLYALMVNDVCYWYEDGDVGESDIDIGECFSEAIFENVDVVECTFDDVNQQYVLTVKNGGLLYVYDIDNTEFTIPSEVKDAINEYIASSQNGNA